MRRDRFVLVVALILPSAGCATFSAQPLAMDGPGGSTFEPALLGDFVPEKTRDEFDSPFPGPRYIEEFLRFERKDPKSNTYVVSSYGVPKPRVKRGKSEPVKAAGQEYDLHLVRLGKMLFADIELRNKEGVESEPVPRLIVRIEITESGLELSWPRPEWFQQNPGSIPCEITKVLFGVSVVIKVSTEELREFLIQKGNDPSLWCNHQRYHRRRVN